MNRRILAIGAHADDIEINVGGLLSKYVGHGYEVVYVMSTNNMSGTLTEVLPDGRRQSRTMAQREMMPLRQRECKAAAAALGTTPIHLNHPQRHYTNDALELVKVCFGAPLPLDVSAGVPTILTAHEDPAARTQVRDLILQVRPEIVFTHGMIQWNMEHCGTCLLVTRAFWEAVEAGYNGSLLHWREGETFLGEHNAKWETFVDYTGHVEQKMELIGMHNCQMPHWRQADFGHRVRALEWGRMCGCEAAEQFTWVRRMNHPADLQTPYGPLTAELIRNTR